MLSGYHHSLELGKQRDQFRLSIQSKVDNPLDTIEKFNKQFRLGEREREPDTLTPF
jgi:hypothetical protein